MSDKLPTHLREQVEKEAERKYYDLYNYKTDPKIEDFRAGAEYLYSLLPKGMPQWIKFSDRKPPKPDTYFVKEQNGDHKNHVYLNPQALDMNFWKDTLWLDETEGEGERGKLAVEFAEWVSREDWTYNITEKMWFNWEFPKALTSSELHELFLKSISSNTLKQIEP